MGGLSALLESVSWRQGVSTKGQEQSQTPPRLDPRLPCPHPISRWPWEGTRHFRGSAGSPIKQMHGG